MTAVYAYLFWFGVFYAGFAFVLGQLGHGGGSEAFHGVDATSVDSLEGMESGVQDGVQGGVESTGDYTVSPFKPIVIATFCILFGGTGMTALRYNFNFWQVFFIALGVGSMISIGMFKGIIEPLYRAQNTSAALRKDLIGLEATVTSPIYKDGYGTISYRINGSICNGPAKSSTGVFIEQGVKIRISGFDGRSFSVTIADQISDNRN